MPKIIALPPMTEDPAADDLLPIHNTSTGDTEKVTIADITGSLNSGWTNVSDTWEYSSWSSTTKTGVITTPSGATSLYGAGMRIRITQATGGTKYGIIVKVTSTELTVYFGTDYTLNNETISAPSYSQQKAPLGFPLDPAKWTVTTTDTSPRTTTSATYASMSVSSTAPIGVWNTKLQVGLRTEQSTGTAYNKSFVMLSSDGSTPAATDLEGIVIFTAPASAIMRVGQTMTLTGQIAVTAATTFTIYGKTTTGTLYLLGSDVAAVIKYVCAYL